MLFNSLTFLVFFVIVFALHRLIPGWDRKKLLLLVASYLFYAAWNPPYVLILLFSTTLDWWLARLIWQNEDGPRRRLLLITSLVSNLSLLGFFKYGGFLLENTHLLLSAVGLHYSPPALDIVLPIGISFYTFASLSYTIDVYRHEVPGDARYLDYALFVSFFPHLVAGPIVRAKLLLPQIAVERRPDSDQLGWGLTLVCLGLFTKSVLADSVFAPVVDAVYGHPTGAVDGWAGVLGFSGQIYCDFSGYSLCAIGLALCFGFEFPDNFRSPYGARGFSDFWRRWHITLSTWLRDYLYIPLGGNRHGAWRTYLSLSLTMLLGGLWHGASWMFVLWGGLHGLYLAIERALRSWTPAAALLERYADNGLTLLTFLVVTLTWIPFRAGTPGIALGIFRTLFDVHHGTRLGTTPMLVCYAAAIMLFVWHLTGRDTSLEDRFTRIGTWGQALAIGCALVGIFLCSGGDERAFIYFQF